VLIFEEIDHSKGEGSYFLGFKRWTPFGLQENKKNVQIIGALYLFGNCVYVCNQCAIDNDCNGIDPGIIAGAGDNIGRVECLTILSPNRYEASEMFESVILGQMGYAVCFRKFVKIRFRYTVH